MAMRTIQQLENFFRHDEKLSIEDASFMAIAFYTVMKQLDGGFSDYWFRLAPNCDINIDWREKDEFDTELSLTLYIVDEYGNTDVLNPISLLLEKLDN